MRSPANSLAVALNTTGQSGSSLMSTHLSRFFSQRRTERKLRLGDLARNCGYHNVAKGANRTEKFEERRAVDPQLIAKLQTAFGIGNDGSNEQLLMAYYNGDDDAFGQLFTRQISNLTLHARQCLPNHFAGKAQSAEYIASECLIKAMATKNRPAARWQPERGAAAKWLRAMVRNQAVDMIRKQQREATLASDVTDSEESFLDSMVPDHREASAKAAVDHEQHLGLLWEMVAQLPDELAEFVTLKYRDGLKHKEIASRLGCSPPTVSRRLEKAEQKLQKLAHTSQAAV
jgi:RNA polymerase sigma factor (sigma-70 family)